MSTIGWEPHVRGPVTHVFTDTAINVLKTRHMVGSRGHVVQPSVDVQFGSQHFDVRWYFCLRAQGPWVDTRPLVLLVPHQGQTIMHTNWLALGQHKKI